MVMAARSVEAELQFQPTEIGEIPADWSLFRLCELSLVTSGKRLPKGEALVQNPTPHPYIRVTDMRMGSVDTSDIRYVPLHLAPAISRYRIFRDDIFVSVAGTLGIVGQIPSELDGANLTENADRITNIKCSRRFLMHVLQSDLIQSQIDEIRTVGAQPKLALARLRQFPIPLPPTTEEQEAIAETLSDADALIESLEVLIAKKRAVKQGAMQDLLSGRKRLPGFSGKWVTKKFGRMVSIRNQKVNTLGNPSAAFCVELENVASNSGRLLDYSDATSRSSSKYCFQAGDVLFGRLRPYLRKFWQAYREGVCSTEIWPLIPINSDLLPDYLYQIVQTEQFIEAASSSYGTHMPRSDWKALGEYEISIPADTDEQHAMAAILAEMDSEVQNLEAKLSKARQIKQGMMQELLTGRIRLV